MLLAYSQVKQLPELLHGVLWPLDSVPNRPRIVIDFVVIAAHEGRVAKEVNLVILDPREALGRVRLSLDMLQAVGLVPAFRKDVERDLATDGEAVACQRAGREESTSIVVFAWWGYGKTLTVDPDRGTPSSTPQPSPSCIRSACPTPQTGASQHRSRSCPRATH